MGTKEQEFLRRLQEGLPEEEVHELLGEFEKERARERAPKDNPPSVLLTRTNKDFPIFGFPKEQPRLSSKKTGWALPIYQ